MSAICASRYPRIEVLSPTTESYDRGEPRVERYLRQSKDGELWQLSISEGLEAATQCTSVDCTLPLSEVYRKIDFTVGGEYS